MFRILIILLLLSGCGNKQILPSPLSELNSIRNLFNFLDFVDDDEEEEAETEWTEEEAVSSGINTSGLIEAETLEVDENGEVYLVGPKDKEIYFYNRDVWIAGE